MHRRANQLVAVAMLVALLVVTWFAFRGIPLTGGYEVNAVVASSNQLRGGSPVRISGVDVGEVAKIAPGPGDTTTVTLAIEDDALPLHRDATLRIRPRVFLEGGFYVELSPGTPAGGELESGDTLPLSQSARPVQFHQLLSVFEQPTRRSLRVAVSALAEGMRGGGARGLRQAARHFEPGLRDLAITAEAARGTEPGDLARLIGSASKVTAALARDERALADLVTNLRVTADALAADDTALAESIGEADLLLRALPSALRAVDAALPVTERVARAARPAVAIAPGALRRTGRVLDELGSLVAPGVRERTVSGLRTAFYDLPTLVTRMAELFPTVGPLSDCLRTHVVPTMNTVVDDGPHTTGRPIWRDFSSALVGLTSAFQNFDANGYATRYLFGGGPNGFSTDSLPGLGRLTGSTGGGSVMARPVRPPGGQPPPIRRDVTCSTQALPSFQAEAGPG